MSVYAAESSCTPPIMPSHTHSDFHYNKPTFFFPPFKRDHSCLLGPFENTHTRMHTHAHTHIYIYPREASICAVSREMHPAMRRIYLYFDFALATSAEQSWLKHSENCRVVVSLYKEYSQKINSSSRRCDDAELHLTCREGRRTLTNKIEGNLLT